MNTVTHNHGLGSTMVKAFYYHRKGASSIPGSGSEFGVLKYEPDELITIIKMLYPKAVRLKIKKNTFNQTLTIVI